MAQSAGSASAEQSDESALSPTRAGRQIGAAEGACAGVAFAAGGRATSAAGSGCGALGAAAELPPAAGPGSCLLSGA